MNDSICKKAKSKWNAVSLYQKYTLEELVKLRKEIETDPDNIVNPRDFSNRDSPNSEHFLSILVGTITKSASKKLDSIGWAITWKIRDLKTLKQEVGSE